VNDGVPGGSDAGLDAGDDGAAGDGDVDGGDGAVNVDGGAEGGALTVPGTWVLIDVSGTPFTMGSPVTEVGRQTDEVEHAVTLTRNFYMMTTEITQQQFQAEMGYNPSSFSGCGFDCPVEDLNRHEVAAYANSLSALEGLGECYSCTGTAPAIVCSPSGSYASPYDCPGYRLPTEAEWEYAARGGTTTATYAGDLLVSTGVSTTLQPIAWYGENASNRTHPVGTKMANAYGLYDMLGNVGEWCHDWYAAYPGGAETDPAGPPSGDRCVPRGGSWSGFARNARAADRNYLPPGFRNTGIGGRIVRSSP
jgi:formylglycine-generating enzyme required for sulfatase activity